MKITFAHTTDWHIGKIQYRKEKRWEDFINAAKKFANQVIPLIKEKKISFIIHTGDIYDSYHPSAGTFLQLYRILEEIREAFIEANVINSNQNSPFYIIRGNHDATAITSGIRGGNALEALHEVKVVTYINDSCVNIGDSICLYGI